jgi:IclR family acetate operon transcriptional repressor
VSGEDATTRRGVGSVARRGVGSVARAMAALDALAASESGLGVNELARRLGVNASTTSRLLGTLQEAGLVERNGTGPYRLGLKLVALSDRVLAQLDVRQRARPLLERLVAETGETATLSLPGAGEAITVDFVPSPSSVVSMAFVGRPSIPHATAVGKVMLAFADRGGGGGAGVAGAASADAGAGGAASADAGAGGAALTALTERTIIDPVALSAELAVARERGWAEAVGERELDLVAVAAPAFGRGGALAAILGVQGPASRLPAAARRAVRAPLLDAAAELGAALGGSAGPRA